MRRLSRRDFFLDSVRTSGRVPVQQSSSQPAPGRELVSTGLEPDVSIGQGTSLDSVESILKTALDGLGGIERFVRPGQVVAIKPNATWAYPPHTASSTDPDLLRALVRLVKAAGAKRIIVMDHCSIDPGTSECLRVSGIGEAVDKLGVEKVFPDRYVSPRELFTTIDLPHGKAFTRMGVIKAAAEADVRINLAVAKCHIVTKYTLCLKHMMGFLQYPNALHAQLEQGITDINTPSRIQANLHILEAVRVRMPRGSDRTAGGFETDLTDPRKVARFNQIVAGVDPVLIDSYGCETFFGIRPDELTHLDRAVKDKLGESNLVLAQQAGKLGIFSVGQPVRTPTVFPSPSPTMIVNTAAWVGSPATVTPLPTGTPSPPGKGLQVKPDASPDCRPETLSFTQVWRDWLLPAAVVVAGLNWVLRRKLKGGGEERGDG